MKDDYSLRFISSVVNEFQKAKECEDESFIVPPSLFEITNLSYLLKSPTVNWLKLNQNIFWRNFTSLLTIVSEL